MVYNPHHGFADKRNEVSGLEGVMVGPRAVSAFGEHRLDSLHQHQSNIPEPAPSTEPGVALNTLVRHPNQNHKVSRHAITRTNIKSIMQKKKQHAQNNTHTHTLHSFDFLEHSE